MPRTTVDEKSQVSRYSLESTPSDQGEWYVTESGLYRLISQRQVGRIQDLEVRASVEAFQNWVFKEVLPTLRKAYSLGIDAIEELKNALEMYKLSDEGAPVREKKAYNRGVMWGQANPKLRLSSVYGFDEWEQDFS